MKKSIFVLFLLLIACAPVATIPPTTTALPPSPTITPSPTATPNPTATPSALREAEGGVQVFENGEWIELKAPEGIWGPVDGSKVVLVDDGEGNQEAYTQMKLQSGFKDIDGDEFVNVAKYNPDTKKWKLVDEITIVRSPDVFEDLSPKFNDMIRFNDLITDSQFKKPIEQFWSNTRLVALKIKDGGSGNRELEVAFIYKGVVFKAGLKEILVEKFFEGVGADTKSLNPKTMSPSEALNVVEAVLKNDPGFATDTSNNRAILSWVVVPKGADANDCSVGSGFNTPSDLLRKWCEDQIKKVGRETPNRSQIDWQILNQVDPLTVDEAIELTPLDQLLDLASVMPEIDGTFFRIIVSDN